MLYLFHARRRGHDGAPNPEDDVLLQNLAPAVGPDPRGAAMTVAARDVEPQTLLEHILTSLDDDKAESVVTIPLRGRSQMADYMVVCSGRSTRQVTAIAEKLADRLKQDDGIVPRIEGLEQGDWVLVDAGDVIVHIFRPELREFYQLEKLWLPAGATAAQA